MLETCHREHLWSNSRPPASKCDRTWPNVGHVWPSWGQLRPLAADTRPLWARRGQEFGQVWSHLAARGRKLLHRCSRCGGEESGEHFSHIFSRRPARVAGSFSQHGSSMCQRVERGGGGRALRRQVSCRLAVDLSSVSCRFGVDLGWALRRSGVDLRSTPGRPRASQQQNTVLRSWYLFEPPEFRRSAPISCRVGSTRGCLGVGFRRAPQLLNSC